MKTIVIPDFQELIDEIIIDKHGAISVEIDIETVKGLVEFLNGEVEKYDD